MQSIPNVVRMIETELDGPVGIVTMGKPPHNLMDGEFLDGIISAYRQVVDDGARCILLRSASKGILISRYEDRWE